MTKHLGGHFNRTCMCLDTLFFIKEKYNISSMIDIGCGPAGMTEYANYLGIYSIGVDGDTTLPKKDYVLFHDYSIGELNFDETFDLAYSAEFLEHVYEKYIANFMPSFQKAQYAFITAAPPGQGGHHHVNEQPKEYWIKVFDECGFDYLKDDSVQISQTNTSWPMIKNNSMFFKNRNKIEVTKNRIPFKFSYEYIVEISEKVEKGLGSKVIKINHEENL